MRPKLVLAAMAVGFLGALVPTSSAQAYCDPLMSELYGRCTNGCVEAGRHYESVDQRTGDTLLPDYYDIFLCLA